MQVQHFWQRLDRHPPCIAAMTLPAVVVADHMFCFGKEHPALQKHASDVADHGQDGQKVLER